MNSVFIVSAVVTFSLEDILILNSSGVIASCNMVLVKVRPVLLFAK